MILWDMNTADQKPGQSNESIFIMKDDNNQKTITGTTEDPGG